MVWDIKYKTVRWGFVESLEPAQVVQVRCSSMVNQSNLYGQVTVRMHTRQVEIPVCFPPSFSSLSDWESASRVLSSGLEVLGFLFFSCDAGDGTQVLMNAKQGLYH